MPSMAQPPVDDDASATPPCTMHHCMNFMRSRFSIGEIDLAWGEVLKSQCPGYFLYKVTM
jgi:hypothetical protein